MATEKAICLPLGIHIPNPWMQFKVKDNHELSYSNKLIFNFKIQNIINPLDAPIPEDPLPPSKAPICTPRQMRLFGKALLLLWPANTTLLAYLVGGDIALIWGKPLMWGLFLQLCLLGVILVAVLIANLLDVKYQHLAYWTRFSQALVLYYLSVQIAFGLLLLFIIFLSLL